MMKTLGADHNIVQILTSENAIMKSVREMKLNTVVDLSTEQNKRYKNRA